MNPEEIKVGDKVLVEAEVYKIFTDGDIGFYTRCRSGHGFIKRDFGIALSSDIRPFCPAPKYDPCRLLRKGDKVRVVEWNGRAPFDCENYEPETAGQLCIVAEDEDAENAYMLHVWKLENMEIEPNDDEREWHAFPICNIELVTPVEEQEPYSVFFEGRFVHVRKGEQVIVSFNLNAHPHAKEAAESERDRLNAEWRKERENG